MSIFKKITDLLKADLLAFIKTDKPATAEEDPSSNSKDVTNIYYKGAWKEEGHAKWAFFEKTPDDDFTTVTLTEDIRPDEIAINKCEEPLPITHIEGKDDEEKDHIKEEEKLIHSNISETVPQEENSVEEVVSITKIGRSKTSRYEEDEKVVDGLIDQREVTGEKNKVKVFFAEDNKSFQIIIKKLLEKSEDMELLNWATDGQDAIDKIKELEAPPDVILMDIAMPRLDGISATKEILQFNPSMKIVMLTAFGDKFHVQNAFDAGAIGFLRKDAGLPLIKEAIKQAARGGRPVHKEIAHYLKEDKI